jgi:FlaA1/EpsC-like NDP-sugar epimerase
MVLADCIAMPCALWTALMLHSGTAADSFAVNIWLYLASILFTVPAFIRLGLYRAVIRFLGIQAALAISLGVTVSTVALITIDFLVLQSAVPLQVFAIYYAIAII